MTEPTRFTTQQAADPTTPAQLLADMAALRPDLRPIVAANPTAYPGLLEWLGSLGEPAVDAALAARAAAAAGPSAVSPPGAFQQPGQPWQGQGQQGQPAQPWQSQGQQGQPWQGQGQQGQPAQPWQGQQMQSGQPYSYRAPGTEPVKKKNTVLIVVLVVVGVLVLLGIGGVFAARALFNNVTESITSGSTGIFDTDSADTYGSDSSLDALWDSCEGGDLGACDDLYWASPTSSGYEDFASSCGGTAIDSGGSCLESRGQPDGEPTDASTGAGDGQAYGDDAALDALWDGCEAGDMAACDELYFASPFGSQYEEFGATCGNRVETEFNCVQE